MKNTDGGDELISNFKFQNPKLNYSKLLDTKSILIAQ